MKVNVPLKLYVTLQTTQPFLGHYIGQLVLAGARSLESEDVIWCKVLLPACCCWRQL